MQAYPSNAIQINHSLPDTYIQAFTLRGKGKSSIRSACFHLNESMIILPAFGSFTGLKNIKPENKDEIFLTNGVDIFKVPYGSDIK